MMRQFANQVWHVSIVYVSQISIGMRRLFLILCFFVLLSSLGRDEPFSIIFYGYISAIFFGNWISDQMKHQFAHSRARLTPSFNLPHSAVPICLIFLGTVGLPSLVATISQINPFPYAAASSVAMAVLLLIRLHPRVGWLACAIFVFAIWYPTHSDREVDFASILLRPWFTIPAFFLAWLGIDYYFFRLCHLAEDDEVYQRLNDETRKVAADGTDGSTRAKFINSVRWWGISDRWHTSVGGFHGFQRIRIIRLLRYGFGAIPVELSALGFATALAVAVLFITPKPEISHDIASSGEYVILMLPALFASMGPIAVAGGAIGWRVPRMKNEIMFPLTRRELIDDLLLASAWNSFVIWFLGCASGLALLLCLLPEAAGAIPLTATAAILTGATAVVAFGLSLHVVMWEVKFAQLFIVGVFAIGFIIMILTWWTTREKSGDAIFWILATIETVFGIRIVHTGRIAWLNLELGQQA